LQSCRWQLIHLNNLLVTSLRLRFRFKKGGRFSIGCISTSKKFITNYMKVQKIWNDFNYMPIPFLFLLKFIENCFKEFSFPPKAINFSMVATTLYWKNNFGIYTKRKFHKNIKQYSNIACRVLWCIEHLFKSQQ